jgi:uncharacterized protein (DUF342 family)
VTNEGNPHPDERLLYRQFKDNAGVHITVDDDELTARADFSPPAGEGLPLTPELVQSEMDAAKLAHGIQWEEINEAMLACNLNRKIQKGVIIARGDPPREEIPERLVLEEKFANPVQLPGEDVAQFDYHTLSPFIMVGKGTVIAKTLAPVTGTPGKTVYGKEIAFGHKKVEAVRPGKNTELLSGNLVVVVDGRLQVSNGEASVEELLTIKGDVDYHTGNVDFPGDVAIDGVIQEGFKVHSGGSIFCKSTLDATEVVAKKDLTAASGIIGRNGGTVRVGGVLTTRFIQNCKVACRSTVRVSGNILNSEVYTLDSIELGDKSRVIGGELRAIHFIKACSIGNESGRATIIRLGTDFAAQQRLAKANERQRILAQRIRRIDAEIKARPSDRFIELRNRMVAEAKEFQVIVSEILAWVDVDDHAFLEVTGDVHAGVTIEICHIGFTVEKTLKHVRFRIDKERGRLVYDNL